MWYSWYSKYIFEKKSKPHLDCSKTGAISKYCSIYPFLYEILRVKCYFLHKIWFKKKELVKFWKIDKWYLCGYCLYFSMKKMGGHGWNIEEGLSQTLKMCQMGVGLI